MSKKEEKEKGILGAIWESMTKTGGCCGPGESCCGSSSEEKAEDKPQKEKSEKSCCDSSDECG